MLKEVIDGASGEFLQFGEKYVVGPSKQLPALRYVIINLNFRAKMPIVTVSLVITNFVTCVENSLGFSSVARFARGGATEL
mgnify:CR=1 FL=1